MKNVVAVLFGCMTGVLFVFLLEALSHSIYPLPENLDPENMTQLKDFIFQLPPGAFLLVLAGYFLSTFTGGLVASYIKKTKIQIPVIIVCLIFCILGSINLIMIPHPGWFVGACYTVYILGAVSSVLLYTKITNNA
ncbi:MAG: hypothetical protein AB7O73_04330 [Bacteroidia bacterium]